MHIISNGSNDKLFVVDGLPYRKGLYEVFYVRESNPSIVKVGIRNIYNQQPVSGPVVASQYSVNTTMYNDSDIVALVTDLSTVLGF